MGRRRARAYRQKFAIINRYDLQAEFPILTIRKTNFEAVIDEILWIWQKKNPTILKTSTVKFGIHGRTKTEA